jgi:peptidoglycan/xylan/chitin deacetylase (PgdA/CDA1 family)
VNKNTVKAAISLVWYCADLLVRGVTRLLGRRPPARFTVLYYHGVTADARAGFARQMRALARRATVIRAGHAGSLPPGSRCVAITFDDAFRSVREHALPALVEQSLPATIFVPVDFVGRAPGWEMESNGQPEEVMTGDELRSLPDLVDLGSHTLRHPHLSRLDDAGLTEEIAGSRRKLAELVDAPVSLLAFPYGDYNDRTVSACREAGYERVFGIDPRPADPLGGDFVRGRIAVEPTDSQLVFHLKAQGAYAWMTYASALKARLLGWRQLS